MEARSIAPVPPPCHAGAAGTPATARYAMPASRRVSLTTNLRVPGSAAHGTARLMLPLEACATCGRTTPCCARDQSARSWLSDDRRRSRNPSPSVEALLPTEARVLWKGSLASAARRVRYSSRVKSSYSPGAVKSSTWSWKCTSEGRCPTIDSDDNGALVASRDVPAPSVCTRSRPHCPRL